MNIPDAGNPHQWPADSPRGFLQLLDVQSVWLDGHDDALLRFYVEEAKARVEDLIRRNVSG